MMQSYAFILSDNPSYFPLISILSSVLAIANASAMISYDKDVDPDCRASVPSFYGAIPSRGRASLYFGMLMFSFCHVIMKVIGTALLASISGRYVGAYLGGDMIFFFLFKLARYDLRYWMNLSGALSIMFTVVARVVAKVMVDFTCWLQGRHAYEEGGLYFSCSIVLSHSSCFVAAHLYIKDRASRAREDDGSGDNSTSGASSQPEKLGAVELLAGLGAIEALFILSFAFYMLRINRPHVKTFFSTMTAKEFCVATYHNATNDCTKIEVFSHHVSYYLSIWGEVETWVGVNWEKWNEEKPVWFTPQVIATIPNELIPVAGLDKLKKKGRRRSSAAAQLLGAPANTAVDGEA